MVSHSTARAVGYTYAVLSIILASFQTVHYTVKLVRDENKADSSLNFVGASSWVIFSILLLVGIIKYNLCLVKAHRVFLFVGNGVYLIYLIVFVFFLAEHQVTAAVSVGFVVGCIIIMGLLALELWIVNITIRSIEHELSLKFEQQNMWT